MNDKNVLKGPNNSVYFRLTERRKINCLISEESDILGISSTAERKSWPSPSIEKLIYKQLIINGLPARENVETRKQSKNKRVEYFLARKYFSLRENRVWSFFALTDALLAAEPSKANSPSAAQSADREREREGKTNHTDKLS